MRFNHTGFFGFLGSAGLAEGELVFKNNLLHWGLRTIVVFERAPHARLSTLISANEPLTHIAGKCKIYA